MALMDAAMWRRPWGGESKFQVTVYDVSAPETPQLVSRLEIEGNYVDSRMIGETVYLVSSHSFHLPAPEIVPGPSVPDKQEPVETLRLDVSSTDPAVRIMPWPGPNPDGSGWVYETREQYWERIGDQVLDLALPNYSLHDAAGNSVQSGLLSAAEATYRPLDGQDETLVSITAFDVGSPQPSVVASVQCAARLGEHRVRVAGQFVFGEHHVVRSRRVQPPLQVRLASRRTGRFRWWPQGKSRDAF